MGRDNQRSEQSRNDLPRGKQEIEGPPRRNMFLKGYKTYFLGRTGRGFTGRGACIRLVVHEVSVDLLFAFIAVRTSSQKKNDNRQRAVV